MTDFILNITAVIGGLSVVCKGLEMVAKITPTTKDDVIVGKIGKGLAWLKKILDYGALNPKV